MSRVLDVNRRYVAAEAVQKQGVSMFVVADRAGAEMNHAVRQALLSIGEDRSYIWNELIQTANVIRWRRLTQPQPNSLHSDLEHLVTGVHNQSRRLERFVSDESILQRLSRAATEVMGSDSPLGQILLESVLEVGPEACVVVANRTASRVGLESWLGQYGVRVVTPSEMMDLPGAIVQSYVVSPPIFLPASLINAPRTDEVTYVIPAWFKDRSLPTSSLGTHAEGRIEVGTTIHLIGETVEPEKDLEDDRAVEDTFLPHAVWGPRQSGSREPGDDEVEAWKVLLGGNLALWLDDGDRIRSLNPRQPEGERIAYEAVRDVNPGTYLVLREGSSERGAMYEEVLRSLGPKAEGPEESQKAWKHALMSRLYRIGATQASRELRERGVRASNQVRAWVDPRLICPQLDSDFITLLDWLGVPAEPTLSNALGLRRALYRASAELRKELEEAVARSDLRALERDGILHLSLSREGFRGMIVAQVKARSPFTEVIPRAQSRVPFVDRSTKWLE